MTSRIQTTDFKAIAMARKKELILQHQRTLEKPKPKREVIKMAPHELRRAERLGYVEIRNGRKVLSKAGLINFLPTLKRTNLKQAVTGKASTSNEKASPAFSTVLRKPDSSSPVIVIDDDDVLLPSPPKKIPAPPTRITFPDDIESLGEQSTGPITKVVKEKDNNIKDAINVPSQDGQISAVPAEIFGGPANAFYLCTAGDDGNLTPINNEALYLDASNQLVPVAPEVVDKETVTTVENADNVVVVSESSQLETPSESIILSTGDGQQIVLDQQTLLALANSGEAPQIMTPDGQQIILPGSPQEILAALAGNQGESIIIQAGDLPSQSDILAAALANTEVFQQEPLLNDVVVSPPVKAHVSETNAVLTQPPIMSTSEQPSNGEVKPATELLSKNLDDSLAEIGVVSTHNTVRVPASLELPITVTNPAIATIATAVPQQISPILADLQIVNTSTPGDQVVTSGLGVPTTSNNSTDEDIIMPSISEAIVESSTNIVVSSTLSQSYEEQSKLIDSTTDQEPTDQKQVDSSEAVVSSAIDNYEESTSLSPPTQRSTAVLTPESADEIIPDTPEPGSNKEPDLSDPDSCFSSEIPIQPNIISSCTIPDSQEHVVEDESLDQQNHNNEEVSDSVNNNELDKDESSEAIATTTGDSSQVSVDQAQVVEPMNVDEER